MGPRASATPTGKHGDERPPSRCGACQMRKAFPSQDRDDGGVPDAWAAIRARCAASYSYVGWKVSTSATTIAQLRPAASFSPSSSAPQRACTPHTRSLGRPRFPNMVPLS